MEKTLGTRTFLTSMFLILVTGVGAVFLGYYFLNHKLPDLNSQNEKLNTAFENHPITKKPIGVNLTLSSPDDNILVFSSNILVQGKSTPNSIVLVSMDDNDQTLDINKDGSFVQTIKLTPGVNNLQITAFDYLGNTQSEHRTIYYSTEKL